MVFMSELFSALILAVVQGVTEWLPVSSSGHLVAFEKILNYSGGLLFEVALHFGTLMAVFVYFGKDIVDILRDLFSGKWKSENGRLGLLLILTSVPAVIFGYFAVGFFDTVLSNLLLVGMGFAVTGVLLLIVGFADVKRDEKITWKKALVIGIAQAIAIIPGVSRSGATISSGVLLGLSEKAAMRFSFLMAIPVIIGANIVTVGNKTLPTDLIWATLLVFVVGLLSIHVCFKYLLTKRKNFRWFGIYALALGIGVLIWTMLK